MSGDDGRRFQAVIDKLEEKPVAISFAFPGPADHQNGIIGGYRPTSPRSAKAVLGCSRIQIRHSGLHQRRHMTLPTAKLAAHCPKWTPGSKRWAAQTPRQESGGLHVRHGSGHRYRGEQRTQPRRQLVRRDFCLKHKKMPDIIVEDGVDPRREARLRRVVGQPGPRAGTKGPLISPTENAKATQKPPARLSPRWADRRRRPW